jgi:hypothetical protein
MSVIKFHDPICILHFVIKIPICYCTFSVVNVFVFSLLSFYIFRVACVILLVINPVFHPYHSMFVILESSKHCVIFSFLVTLFSSFFILCFSYL